MMSPVTEWLIGRKRYGCSDCKWRGWKQPLQRRGHAKPRPIERLATQQVSPATSALVIAASIIGIGIASLQGGCESRTANNPSQGPVNSVRNPLW